MIAEYFIYKHTEQTNEQANEQPNKENYHGCSKNIEEQKQERLSTPLVMLMFIIYLILGIYAARLSWFSNTKAGWNNGYKVLFAIFAFMFPVTYITAHIIFKLDLLSKIKVGHSYKM